jgi:hypothetical protein
VITHIVMFRWKPEVSEEQLAEISAVLDTLPPAIPTIRSYRHGRNIGAAPTNFDYVIIATFDDVDGWREYDKHPVHEAARADVIKPWIVDRSAVQIES